jgi:hypothetical protein
VAPTGNAYRVEYRDAGGRVVLGHLPAGTARHHASLAPFAAHLRLAGHVTGHLALIDPATGAVVARRAVVPRPGTRAP